jgi:hypothetical protein
LKKNKLNTSKAKDILFNIKLDEANNPLNECFFHNDDLHFCEDGLCSKCDYDKYLKTVSEEDFNSWNFIEGWEWKEIWIERYKK